ncbi:hypothetical protein [Pseudodesulfovibrio sp.]|uniref:hypothetical protein n=1 Tax=Pseudodesulfovibrio sp. TaxID=2035812 RepID=UPI00262E4048|nr:hypothetical protein [Pseudodesulfovibrio sp.]MDD3313608.1 hypothetical protein [Pseudodesulfovibrio sp.]
MSRRFSTFFVLAGLLAWLAATPALAGGSFAAAAGQARRCGVSGEVMNTLSARVAQGSLDEAGAGSLLAPLLEACADRLPLAPIEDKLAEGLAKNVPPERIAQVLARRVADYRRGRELLASGRGGESPENLVVLGEGLAMGVPEADFAAYLAAFGKLPEPTFLTGLAMVSYQGQAGFPPDLTLGVIRQGAEAGTLGDGYRYLVRIILAARRRGLADAAVADAARAALRDGKPVTDVVTRLGFTGRSLSGLPDGQ